MPIPKSVYESETGEIRQFGDKLQCRSRQPVDQLGFISLAVGVEDEGRENDEQSLVRAVAVFKRPHLGPPGQRVRKVHSGSALHCGRIAWDRGVMHIVRPMNFWVAPLKMR